MDTLLPCPFCGGSAGVSTGQWGDDGQRDWLECRSCGTQQHPYDEEDPDGWAKMLAAWNTRTPSGSPLPESDSADHLGVVIGRKDTSR